MSSNAQVFTPRADNVTQMAEVANAVVNGKLYLFGGMWNMNPHTYENRVLEYDPEKDAWETVSSFPEAIHVNNHFTVRCAVRGNEVWIVGGKGPKIDSYHGQVHVFNVATKTWRESVPLPEGRWSGVTAIVGDKLHYITGYGTGSVHEDASKMHFVLDLSDEAAGWKSKAEIPFPAGHAAATVDGGKIYVTGGEKQHNHRKGDYDLTRIYDTTTNQWSMGAAIPVKVTHHDWSTVLYDGSIYIVSGINWGAKQFQYIDKIYKYDIREDSWTVYGDLPVGLTSASANVIGDTLYITGGGVNDWFEERENWGGKKTHAHVLGSAAPPE